MPTRQNIVLVMIILLTIGLTAENPSSSNYILKQASIGTSSDPANPPSSANYILTGSSIGTISDNESESSNYKLIPGYYLGKITGDILPPENVTITVVGSTIQISWDIVQGANSYKIYSSDDPSSGFVEDSSGTFVDESWSTSSASEKKFYYVTADNSIFRLNNKILKRRTK